MASMYKDEAECPKGHRFTVSRRATSAGRVVGTYCPTCRVTFEAFAGPAPAGVTTAPTSERQVEARLVKRVAELGGEVRKVQWIGRRGAPDRLVMLPARAGTLRSIQGEMRQAPGGPAATIWVELKAPGKAATFPRTPHEHAQHREHERMRAMGQRVEVVDSYEQIEEILK